MAKWFTKKLVVPENNETKEIDAVQLWEVRWISRHGSFHHDTRQQLEAFPEESEARAFAEALRNAFKLIRHTSQDRVSVVRAR
jgi:hypothetical protein